MNKFTKFMWLSGIQQPDWSVSFMVICQADADCDELFPSQVSERECFSTSGGYHYLSGGK